MTGAPSMAIPKWLLAVVPAGLLLVLVTLMYRTVVGHTGHFAYPLDDTYIHMALARHIAEGVYGVTAHEFATASSSIAWPYVLAALARLFGDRELTPLVANAVAGAVACYLFVDTMRREAPRANVLVAPLFACAIVFLTPLPTLVILGMEHTLHVVATVAFVAASVRWLVAPSPVRASHLYALAFLVCAVRYEGVLAVFVVAVLSVVRGRRQVAAALLASGASPIVAFGLYSVARGGTFVPTPILLKRRFHIAGLTDITDFLGGDLSARLQDDGHLLGATILLAGALVWAKRNTSLFTPRVLYPLIAFVVLILHVQFANVGWFFRYEAYAVALAMLALGVVACDRLAAPAPFAWFSKEMVPAYASALAAAFLIVPLARRARDAASFTPAACRNVFEQQLQSARFLAKYFDDEPVAINDIGAVAYLRRGPIVDLAGLASMTVAKRKGFRILETLTPESIDELTRGTNVAVVYDDWFPGGFPKAWTRVAKWTVGQCRSCASPSVSVYATSLEALPRVIVAARSFAGGELPAGVAREGLYLREAPSSEPDATYRLNEGDVVHLRVPFSDPVLASRFDRAERLTPDGAFPIALSTAWPRRPPHHIPARGQTLSELAATARLELAESKEPALANPPANIQVLLVKRRPGFVTVTGNVPGSPVAIELPISARQALERAGGRAPWGRREVAPFVWREEPSGGFRRVPLADLDVPLEPNDIVAVP